MLLAVQSPSKDLWEIAASDLFKELDLKSTDEISHILELIFQSIRSINCMVSF